MSKTKIVLNRDGVRALMQSPEMQAILMEHASKMSSETESYVAGTRAVVKVLEIMEKRLLKKVGKYGRKNS